MSAAAPMYRRAPLEYRYALDAATTLLPPYCKPLLICNVAQLEAEVRLRFGDSAAPKTVSAALWVEPLSQAWRTELQGIADALAANAPLIVIASQPLAVLLPERRSWPAPALCLQPQGMRLLSRALRRAGFRRVCAYGIHGFRAMGLGMVGRLAERAGRPELADRLEFAARLRYREDGYCKWLSSVQLMVCQKAVLA